MSSKEEIRLAQLIQTFGPGALVDFPDKSVMVMGLDGWPFPAGMREIEEPRLIKYLTKLLESPTEGDSWIQENTTLSLFEPPLNQSDKSYIKPPVIPAVVYPRWEVVSDSSSPDKQELRWYTSGGISRKKKGVVTTPIRWVSACRKGHIDDINWRSFIHKGQTNCKQTLYLRDEGAGGDPQFITGLCECGKSRSLSELYVEGTLGVCQGHRPWIKDYQLAECQEKLLPMTRGAINNYYSQILKLIALPVEQGDLPLLIEKYLDRFDNVDSLQKAMGPIEYGDATLKNSFAQYDSQEIWTALLNVRNDRSASSSTIENPKLAEFKLLASGKQLIGTDELNARLHAETLPNSSWENKEIIDTSYIHSLVKVHRLCEVTSLYGFTRIEPAPTPFEDGQEDINLEVSGQPLANKVSWLPAMEQFGEGLFLHLDADVVRKKMKTPIAVTAISQLKERYNNWYKKDTLNRKPFPGSEYVFAHSLSHLLIEQIALDAGYPSTSLNERIYALTPAGQNQRTQYLGVLIYAAGGGSQGTLGGLLEQSSRLPDTIKKGVKRHQICSNDPICSTQSDILTADADLINGAACHGCLFTAETSCERRNILLDRTSLLEIIG